MNSSVGISRRFWRAVDALSLSKLLFGVFAFVLWDGSPLYALGAAFAAPIWFAALVRVWRELSFALTGSVYDLRGAPPERLGRPTWERQHHCGMDADQDSGRWR